MRVAGDRRCRNRKIGEQEGENVDLTKMLPSLTQPCFCGLTSVLTPLANFFVQNPFHWIA